MKERSQRKKVAKENQARREKARRQKLAVYQPYKEELKKLPCGFPKNKLIFQCDTLLYWLSIQYNIQAQHAQTSLPKTLKGRTMLINSIVSKRSIDQLEEDIVNFAGRINQAEYEFLVLIREFDLRQGWKAYHFNNCAEWIDMK